MGGCIPQAKSSKEAIYKINIPEPQQTIVDPVIQNQVSFLNAFRQPICCSVSKHYFSIQQQQHKKTAEKSNQPTGVFSPQKISNEDRQMRIKQQQKQKENELLVKQFKQKYHRCIELYGIHQIDKANQLATILLLNLKQIPLSNIFQIQKQLLKIKNQHRKVHNFQNQVLKTGWEFKGEDKGIKVSSRRQTDTVAVLIQAQINIPVEILAAVLTEVDLFYKFVPFMESSKQLKVCARNAKIGHCINNLPLISKRQAFFFGIGYDRLQHNGSIFIYTESLLENKQLMKQHDYYPETTKGAVQLDYKYLIFEYIPKDKKSGFVRLAINVDMKLPYVPMFIMDPVTRDFGYDFFKNMIKISKNFENSDWKTRVAQRPDLFNFFKNRVEQHLGKQGR